MPKITIRPATAADQAFLTDMLVEAANAPHYRETREQLLANPQKTHYVTDWPRPTDLGVVATNEAGQPLGAAWLRYFPAEDPAYGFVNESIPELAIGVIATERGKGLGRQLLRAIATKARESGATHISLSVDRENPALHLYKSEGYHHITSGETSDTMLLTLQAS